MKMDKKLSAFTSGPRFGLHPQILVQARTALLGMVCPHPLADPGSTTVHASMVDASRTPICSALKPATHYTVEIRIR